MNALPFTYCVKGRYWYFRHDRVGQVRIIGEPGEPLFMEQYRKWLRRAGHTLKSAKATSALRKAGKHGSTFRVYFIQAGEGGPIKIGCAVDVARRLSVLQTGSVEPLKLLCDFEGGPNEERRLHRLFAADHLRGEWFRPSAAVLDHIANIDSTNGSGANYSRISLLTGRENAC
jgi:hypothetical protein